MGDASARCPHHTPIGAIKPVDDFMQWDLMGDAQCWCTPESDPSNIVKYEP